MDEGSELRQMVTSLVKTPNERSQKLLASVESKKYINNEQSQGSIIVSSDEEEGCLKEPKLKIDLSVVSFLKPHIVNDGIYKLSHQGFTKKQMKKSEVIK